MQSFILFICTLSVAANLSHAVINPATKLRTVNQWNTLPYNFPYGLDHSDPDIYAPENIVATGIAVTNDRIFIATPRLFSGVPATISSIRKDQLGDGPVLEAYPDWSFHTPGKRNVSCDDLSIISVYRFKIDSCNRMWILDAGVSRSLEDFEKTCPPKILVFDLHTNQVVRRIDFPPEVLRGESLFTNMIIDETTANPGYNCDDVFVYITDTVEAGIIVYDSSRDMTWRVSHPAMFPDPDYAQTEILGQKFVLMDGVVGIAFDESDLVYFQPLATDRLFSISKQVLRAGPIAINEILPVKLVGKKSSQGIGLAVTQDKSIIFSPMTETAIAMYNPFTNQQSILAYDPDRLQFVADIAIPLTEKGRIYVLSSKFHRYFLKNLNPHETNIRILEIDLPSPSPLYTTGFTLPYGHQYSGLSKPNFPYFPITSNGIDRHSNSNYFTSVKQPNPYESFGTKDALTSFYSLNKGESFPGKIKPLTFNSKPFNGNHNRIRFAKSIPNNETAIF